MEKKTNYFDLNFKNYFSSSSIEEKWHSSIKNKWKNYHKYFYEKTPQFSIWPKQVRQRSQDALDGNFEDLVKGTYSQSSRWLLSSQKGALSPEKHWSSFKSCPQGNLSTSSIFTANEKENKNIVNVNRSIHEILEKRGGPYLSNFSQKDLRFIWKNLKAAQEYDAMVEIFDFCRPSKFTSNNTFLADYAFAHLNSSYCQPGLASSFAKKLEVTEKKAEIHYLQGLALYSCAKVAQSIAISKMNLRMDDNNFLMDVYKKCFPGAGFNESAKLYLHSLAESEHEFEQAFFKKPNAVFALGYILNLIEQKKIEEAKKWSVLVLEQLSLLERPTPYQTEVYKAIGLIAEMPV